jgi:hypothetical protein
MDTQKSTAAARIEGRIEELLEQSTLPPETVFKILRAARANPDYDAAGEIERLQHEQRRRQ